MPVQGPPGRKKINAQINKYPSRRPRVRRSAVNRRDVQCTVPAAAAVRNRTGLPEGVVSPNHRHVSHIPIRSIRSTLRPLQQLKLNHPPAMLSSGVQDKDKQAAKLAPAANSNNFVIATRSGSGDAAAPLWRGIYLSHHKSLRRRLVFKLPCRAIRWPESKNARAAARPTRRLRRCCIRALTRARSTGHYCKSRARLSKYTFASRRHPWIPF